MKRQFITRRITIVKEDRQWYMHQQFKDYTEKLNRLPDAGEVQRNKLRSAPAELVPLLF